MALKVKTYNNVQANVTFSKASSRVEINPTAGEAATENIALTLGKISKWYEALVPTGGSSGKILAWNTAGTAKWSDPLHPSVTKSADTTSTASPAHGGTFTTVDTVTRDAYGHVTKINTKTVTLPNDTSMTQTNTTGSADYRVLLSGNANDTTETTTGRKSTKLKFNPSSGGLYSFGFLWTDITGQTLDINTLTLSDGTLHSRRFIEKTDGGAGNITNIPVTGKPFLLEVDLIRWASTTDYITRQRFTNAANGAYSYVRYCTNGTWGNWTTRKYTDTNTKVTSSANHYAPATVSGQDKSASASGATAAWSIDVVKGVTLNTDGKGHVTGLSVTSGKIPANPNTTYTLGTSGNNVTLTPSSGSVQSITVPYATSANKLNTNAGSDQNPVYFSNGIPVACKQTTNASWYGVPEVRDDGVMEIGKIIDFHSANTSTADYDLRLQYTGTATGKTVTLPGATGTVALLTKGSTSYWGMIDGDGGTTGWIRTTSNGLISATGVSLANGGDGSLGTSSWAFKNAYIANINGVAVGSTPKFTDANVTQAVADSSYTNYRPLLIGNSSGTSAGFTPSPTTAGTYATAGIYCQPSSGYVYASDFMTNTYPSGTGSSLSQYGLYLKSYFKCADSSQTVLQYAGYGVRTYSGKITSSDGIAMAVGCGGLTVLGSGESAHNLISLISDDQKISGNTTLNVGGTLNTTFAGNSEVAIVSSDDSIYLITNCQTIANRKPVCLDTNSYFYPGTNKTGSIGTSSYMWNSVYAATIYENGTSLASKYAAIGHAHGLLHSDLNQAATNGTTGGWSVIGIDPAVTGYVLKSIRINEHSPNWLSGNYGAGIAFGGYDTKGVISMNYHLPTITFAGGNHSSSKTEPVWYIKISGTSGSTYNLANFYDSATSRTANTVLAAPNGSNGGATFRKLVAADLPSHTHSYLPLSGTTINNPNTSSVSFTNGMTGNILFTNTGNTNGVARGIGGIVGTTDSWSVRGYQTGDNKGCLEIAVGDDGDEGIYARQYTSGQYKATFSNNAGTASGLTYRELVLMAPDTGASTFPSDVTLSGGQLYLSGGSGSYGQLNLKTGSYNVMFRNDNTNTYILLTAKDDPNGSWTSARPLTINNSTGVCSINGNATSATILQTARNINGVSFDGSANITIPRSIKHIHTAIGTQGTAGWVKIATITVTNTYANHPMTFTIAQRGIMQYRIHLVLVNNGSVAAAAISEFIIARDNSWTDTNNDPRAYIIKPSDGVFDLYIKKIENYDHIFVVDFTKADDYEGNNYSVTWTDVHAADSAITGGTEATKKTYSTTDHTHNYAGSSSAGGPATYVGLPRVTADSKSFPGQNKVEFKEYSNTSTNTPSSAWYHIISMQGADTKYGTQLALGMTTNAVYYRNYNNSAWIDWQPLGRFTATPTTGQVVITDGTTGGIKSSGSTIVATPSSKVNTNWGTASDRTTIVTKGWMSYWDGSYDGSASNLTYCNKGAFGTIITKNTGDYVPSHGNLNGTIGSNSPATDVKTFFMTSSVPTGCSSIGYNTAGNEYTLIFGKGVNTAGYGAVLKFGYDSLYPLMLRVQNGTWKSTDWEKISAGYADIATSVSSGGTSSSWWNDRDNSIVKCTTGDTNYRPLWSLLTASTGSWAMGNHTGDDLIFNFISKAKYDAAANPATLVQIHFTNTGGITSTGTISAATGVDANTANSSTAGGLSLYSTNPDNYGVIFRGTSQKGKHGYVTSDWATYFTMNDSATRGWVFNRNASSPANVASISGGGNAVFNGSVTVGGNAANTSGCRLTYNSSTQSLDFIFA